MIFTKGKKVYVYVDPHIFPSFTEVLTIQKQSERLLFFEEKDSYYAVEYKKHLFYAYSYNIAGNVLVVEQLWHLPFAKVISKFRCLVLALRRKSGMQPYGKELKNDTLSTF